MQSKFKKAFLANFNVMNNLLVTTMIMRSKFANNALLNFDLMNNWLAASTVMRLNLFKFIKLHLWVILALIINHLCIKTFDLMIAIAANKLFMRLKFANNDVLGFDHIIKVLTS